MAGHFNKESGGAPPSKATGRGVFLARISDYFFRLNIVRKLLLGYLPLCLLLVLFAVLGMMSLTTLNQLNGSIIETDIPLSKIADQLTDDVLAHELYARRYSILRDSQTLEMFSQSQEDFQRHIETIADLPEQRDIPLKQLLERHRIYCEFLSDTFVVQMEADLDKMAVDTLLHDKQEQLVNLIQDVKDIAHQDQLDKTLTSAAMGENAFNAAIIVCWVGIAFSLLAAVVVTRNIAGTIHRLQKGTEEIAAGNFDYDPGVKNTDELGDLAAAFKRMANRLKVLEASYRDASPLTGLPGGISIGRTVDDILATDSPLSFCLLDIDSFKAFNDCYGFSRGNRVIEAAAEIIKDVVEEKGAGDDFVGHIGGDDFVLLCKHYNFRPLCEEIVARFDKEIRGFYDEKDRDNGFVETENRQGVFMTFPIASLSVAVVTNEKRPLHSHLQVGEIAAEVKKVAKKKAGSAIIVDTRLVA